MSFTVFSARMIASGAILENCVPMSFKRFKRIMQFHLQMDSYVGVSEVCEIYVGETVVCILKNHTEGEICAEKRLRSKNPPVYK